ncbi:MAG: calcineurin-like phosphoesterase C-terminal domain-containing protein [Bacteroidales bacterium]|nr:calcineurin-like phosphoesterase C-terminal domain-containing protein [Bacteroidales bacterium]
MKKTFVLILALAAVLVSCEKQETGGGGNSGGNVIPSHYTIYGTIQGNDGKKLSDVVVSDGKSCFKTGADGKYYIDADVNATDYVFVSTPSGYSAPVQDGHAIFWKFLKDVQKGGDGRYNIDFTLNKISNPERYTVLIFADPQPRKSTATLDKVGFHSLDCCNDMYRDMKEYAGTISGRPVYGIGLGDIVHQDLSLLPQYRQGMATTGISTYNVIGNHDQQHIFTTDELASKPYEAIMGPANYSFNLGGMHYLMLDNMIAGDPAQGKYSDECTTGLTKEIWEWVKKDLSYVSPSTPLMVCAHSPMMRTESGSDRNGAYLGDLRNLLSKFPKAYVWAGHTHTSFNYVDKANPKIETHTVSRVTGQLWVNDFLGGNGTPRGYIVFEYDKGKVSWKFKPIYYQTGTYVGSGNGSRTPDYTLRDWDYTNGKAVLKSTGKALDESYQMQVFPPGTYAADDKTIYVNVFLWDELWSNPKIYVDGVPTTMTRVTAKDFRYSYSDWQLTTFYSANTSIGSEFTPDKNNCSSMFRAFVDKAHGTGTVKVTDRFGVEHTSLITW